jgi:hypothetical protein
VKLLALILLETAKGESMRIRGCTIEYNLHEAAEILKISPEELKQGVEKGRFQYYYCLKSEGYLFHNASLLANQELLSQRNRLHQASL